MTPTTLRPRRWLLPQVDPTQVASLAHEARLPHLIAELLSARGVSSASEASSFLAPGLDHLLDPYAMQGMAPAVERIEQAIARGESMLIYGDYDVDGTTATVLLKTAIESLGGTVRFHVPHRLREGYGMQSEILANAAADGVRLVISVDTGIRAFAAADAAASLGLDLIVTDHHLPEATQGIPQALAVLNPNQAGCSYPCKFLCGAGVAFKLSQALLEKKDPERARTKILPSFLKLLAIATIADSVPLLGENRAIVAIGLKELRRPVGLGLRALMQEAKLDTATRPLTATDVAFRIAPRINAAGRMDIASEVIELFITRDSARAHQLAARLERLNTERREKEASILDQITAQLAQPEFADARCIVIDGDGWHRGVIGIIASRIIDQTGKPALVITHENGEAHGSGRSIEGYHLLDALESCAQLFTRFGGHAHAVGFSLPSDRVPELRAHLVEHARTRITDDDLAGPLTCHAELPLDHITPALYSWLRRIEPFGMGNPEPVFIARNVRLASPVRTLKEKHVRLNLAQGPRGTRYSALGWHWAERVAALNLQQDEFLHIAYRLRLNEHPEYGGLELEIADLQKPSP
ncbi:MAG: single-stranded-DNA-specific exonuclease RecJ [Acidobacteriaceae bacterium]